ncbi:beta-ketoacyl synthase chain length factor [Vibrio makurazakiensis]|uniref:beta-ketoacyl synthase chain length factor n=1 Tax=Vibrio makurazakiensis TaxID=2910250 RepID=UPI003D10A664
MSNHSQLMTFNIESWNAQSLGLTEQADWEQWAKTQMWPTEGKIDVSGIPPMMRRRMSVQSKLAVQAALSVVTNQEIDYLVFASRHGELHRTVTLIDNILQGEDASPMAFAQSVHNTAAGLTTIAAKRPIPLTSIAGGEDTFHNALLDGLIYLSENPSHRVLVIDFDQPLPNEYRPFETLEFADYALGLVLTSGHQFSLQRSVSTNNQSNATDAFITSLPQGLQCLNHLVQRSGSWLIKGRNQSWHWNNCS